MPLIIVWLLTPSHMFTETSGHSCCQQKSGRLLNLLLAGWSLSKLQQLKCPQPKHQCFQQHTQCFVASRMSFMKLFEIFQTLSHLLSRRALQMHTTNSVIITIKLIHHHIISGHLMSVINSYVPLLLITCTHNYFSLKPTHTLQCSTGGFFWWHDSPHTAWVFKTESSFTLWH